MGKIHLIMPMGGAGSRFQKEGYTLPKPLLEINGRPFFYWAAQSVAKYIDCIDITFVVLREHIEKYKIKETILRYYPQARFVVLEQVLNGPLFTCLLGSADIHDEKPVIFNDCDHMFKCSQLNNLINMGNYTDAGSLLTFESQEPQFSYVRYLNGKIRETVEKVVASTHAICGAYVFANIETFFRAAEIYKKNCPYKEFFMSGVYNVLCEQNKQVNDYLVDFHVDYGTPHEYEIAKQSRFFSELE
ncbi:hypothetical protein [Selenomonas montiformis]|uniref:hypothetical protein n=1 Tax=Selenomonas montiformis TaxID=2652285 RepID=UPI0039F5A97C